VLKKALLALIVILLCATFWMNAQSISPAYTISDRSEHLYSSAAVLDANSYTIDEGASNRRAIAFKGIEIPE